MTCGFFSCTRTPARSCVAATLTADPASQELTYFSFPIEKREDAPGINPVDGTPDLVIWGKATDGTVDGDREIVDPEWSAAALKQWFTTGANVRMAHDGKRPVGKGLDVEITPDGHYVKSLIADPLAKHYIRAGILNDYSVGIANPGYRHHDPELDPQGKAVRIITGRPDGSSRIAELSVVDRGSNFNTRFQLVKAAGDGTPEYVGKVLGGADGAVKTAGTVNVDLPADVSVSFSPADLAKLVEHRRVAEKRARAAADMAVKRDFDPDVGGGVDRDKLPDSDFAGRNRSFPIVTPGDVSDALHSIGRAGPGNYPPKELKRRILAIARRKGFPIPDADKPKKGKKDKGAGMGEADVVKCVTCAGTGEVDGHACPDCSPPGSERG